MSLTILVNEHVLDHLREFGLQSPVLTGLCVEFCQRVARDDVFIWLNESMGTSSIYITVEYCGRSYRVRFADHPPSRFYHHFWVKDDASNNAAIKAAEKFLKECSGE